MQISSVIAITAILFLANSCSILFPDRTAPKSATYSITPPAESIWIKLPVSDDPNAPDALKADSAYESQKTGAIISINSLCRKYQDETVDDLSRSLVIGIKDKKTLSEKMITIGNSSAKDSLLEGTVEDVTVNIRTIVMKKNFCSYDFIYVALPAKYNESLDDFEKFVSSFSEH